MKHKLINNALFSAWMILLVFYSGCEKKVEINPETAKRMITHRNLGLAYFEEGRFIDAADEFKTLVNIFPEEPLGYANLGLTYMQMSGKLKQAEKWLLEAIQLAPDHPDMSFLLAKVYELTLREKQAVNTLENILKTDPKHIRSLHQLAIHYSKKSDKKAREKAIQYLAEVVSALPANIATRLKLIELLLIDGKSGDAVHQMETIRQILPRLPDGSKEIFQIALDLMRSNNAEKAYTPAIMFHNVMKPTPVYGASLTRLRGNSGPIAGAPIYRFSHTVSLPMKKGIPDAVNFTDVTQVSGLNIVSTGNYGVISNDKPLTIMANGDYDGDGDQDIFISQWLSSAGVSRQRLFTNNNGSFSDLAEDADVSHSGRDLFAQFADVDNDGYLDLFIINTISNRLYHNIGDGTFQDVSAAAGLDSIQGSQKMIFADFDLEGDLDIFLATSSKNKLYRNNLDGTYTEIAEEAGINGKDIVSRDMGFGDFDDDGDMDLIVINKSGSNRYYDNLRQGFFRDITDNSGLITEETSGALAVCDYNHDGYLDLFITDLAGEEHSLFLNLGDGSFAKDGKSAEAFKRIIGFSGLDAAFFDADNDGYMDLVMAGEFIDKSKGTSGIHLFYNNGAGQYLHAAALLPKHINAASQLEVLDYDGDGDLDIVCVGTNGSVHLLRNDGGNVNNFLVVRLAGLRTGSTKNNSFGIGAKVEVKAGDLYQMQVMSNPVAHFGLGNRDGADVVRVVWSNGVPQNRFNPERNQTLVETQILKGSCPWLYAWNGTDYEFVTDVLWASALGMPLGIMSGEPFYAFPNSASEYFKIPGEKLKQKNGKYLLQFTTELWETPYLDQVKLLAIDHPENVDIFVDGTFTPPPFPPFRIYTVTHKRQPVSAWDDRGNDVLKKITYEDEEYVSNLTPSTYQGVTEPHDLILDLGDLSDADSVFLFLNGWLFPTDASINMNMAQSADARSIFSYLQVIDDEGNWKTVIKNLSFPKGKNKTMVVDLTGKFITDDTRIRIQTNMLIYWNYIFYSTNVSGGSFRKVSLDPMAADLHYRGFSKLTWETYYSPSIPDYETVSTDTKWRDLIGHYTRYGNVLSLLQESDNSYVIMNAGDEVTLEFNASQIKALPTGWSRDFIFYNNGWLKDGDLNTANGQTVKPLPFHGMVSYPYTSEDVFPSDEKQKTYMEKYNTRIITTDSFKEYIRNIK